MNALLYDNASASGSGVILLSGMPIRLSIFWVALIAAKVWSESRPRVLTSLPLISQVMIVSHNASVLPPGGIRTV